MNNEYLCEFCKERFFSKKSFSQHIIKCKKNKNRIIKPFVDVCDICGKQIKSKSLFTRHIKEKHNITFLDYMKKYKNFIPPNCISCGKNKCLYTGKQLIYLKYCEKEKCKKLYIKNTNKRISLSMKIAHKEGRAWNIGKSRWKSLPSYPEKFFINVIKNEFNDKNYKREYNVGRYSLDFAWVEKGIYIEIDGEQHLLKENKKRDKEKDLFLKNLGWKGLRIEWKLFTNNTKEIINICNKFVNSSKISIKYKQLLKNKIIKEKEIKKIKKLKKLKRSERISDFSKNIGIYGIFSILSKKWGISRKSVRIWIKNNIIELYDKHNSLLKNNAE